METSREIKKVYELVEKLMQEDIRCRNDDKWLTYRVMRHFTNIFIPFEDFKKIPAFETIKRTRAKIQNVEERLVPTDEKVRQRRKQRIKVFKEFLR